MSILKEAINEIYEKLGLEGLCLLKALILGNKVSHSGIKYHGVHILALELCPYVQILRECHIRLRQIKNIINSVVGKNIIDVSYRGNWRISSDYIEELYKCTNEVFKEKGFLNFYKIREGRDKREESISTSHDEIVSLISDIGKKLGYRVETEYSSKDEMGSDVQRYDVVWFKPYGSVPHRVFEVIGTGSDIEKALIRLMRAYEKWNTQYLYIVLIDENKKQRLNKMLKEIPIGSKVILLSANEITLVHKLINTIIKIIRE